MAVSADQIIEAKYPGKLQNYPALTAKTFYEGALAFLVAGSGFLTDAVANGANPFGGVVASPVANPGASGDKQVECYTEGVFYFTGADFTQAMVGDKVYATDNGTVTTTSTNATRIGTVAEFVSATRIGVRITVGDQVDAVE